MDVVFATDNLDQARRYAAWRDAICDNYVHVDVCATRPEDYQGFIREARFGDVTLTDILVSEQTIRREPQHIARLDKDCYYVQFIRSGSVEVGQRARTHHSDAARGALFCASEPYELRCVGEVRSYYVELPHDRFADRFSGSQAPVSASIFSTTGLGRIAAEFCAMLATEGAGLDEGTRGRLGEQLIDLLALTLETEGRRTEPVAGSIARVRLRSIQRWIEDHLADPDLTLELTAQANQVSLRYLHALFRPTGMSVSEWIWDRRLQRSYGELAKGRTRSITAIAFDNGFASASHFSTMFRRRFGVAPREVVGGVADAG